EGLAFYGGEYFYGWADNSNSTGGNPEGAPRLLDIHTARGAVGWGATPTRVGGNALGSIKNTGRAPAAKRAHLATLAPPAARAAEAGAVPVCFPELAVTGYPPEDLVLRPQFVRDNLTALESLAEATRDGCPVLTGFVDRSDAGLHNAAGLLAGGSVVARYHK